MHDLHAALGYHSKYFKTQKNKSYNLLIITNGKYVNANIYHDVVVTLATLEVNPWHTMTAAKHTVQTEDKVKVKPHIQHDFSIRMTHKSKQIKEKKKQTNKHKTEGSLINLPLIRRSILTTFATSMFKL